MYVCKVNLKWLIKMAGIDAFPYHCNQRVYSMNEYLSLSAHMLLNPPYLLIGHDRSQHHTLPSTTLHYSS